MPGTHSTRVSGRWSQQKATADTEYRNREEWPSRLQHDFNVKSEYYVTRKVSVKSGRISILFTW